MAEPFHLRWELSSLRVTHGAFVEAGMVRGLAKQAPGEWWVERPAPGVKPEHVARLQRRWWLASKLTAPAWPALLEAGEDGGQPWVVLEAPGRRAEGIFPFSDSSAALRAVRGLALAAAEAEALLATVQASPNLTLRPAMLTRTGPGALRFHLAALDATPDEGFPASPLTWSWTPEALFGQPESARSNVFSLGWLLALALTGRWPWAAVPEGQPESAARELLRAAYLAGRPAPLQLPEALKPVEPVLRRALQVHPSQRFASSAAFAQALEAFSSGVPLQRAEAWPAPVVPRPALDPRFEALAPALAAKLLASPDDEAAWRPAADALAAVGSPRAPAVRGEVPTPPPELVPRCDGEQLAFTWKRGYVRALTATPKGEASVEALGALLAHPSLALLTELRLEGPLPHARRWVEALTRFTPPAALRLVHVAALDARSGEALDLAVRLPRWAWSWGGGGSGIFQRLFGRG